FSANYAHWCQPWHMPVPNLAQWWHFPRITHNGATFLDPRTKVPTVAHACGNIGTSVRSMPPMVQMLRPESREKRRGQEHYHYVLAEPPKVGELAGSSNKFTVSRHPFNVPQLGLNA
ncbi:hypothetical protein MO973_10455, partial [Paenibacillus sp. TRM 82003]|nr:hypothetical protein [Paenibacillus sp. TRM 82003]